MIDKANELSSAGIIKLVVASFVVVLVDGS